MRRPLILIALLAPGLFGCATARHFSPGELNRRYLAADLRLTSPLPDVRVEVGRKACDTPCTLRLLPGEARVRARDPQGRIDFTYQVVLTAGLNELEVLAPPR
jgi:hypothetical protein